jgi:hypothetical protein
MMTGCCSHPERHPLEAWKLQHEKKESANDMLRRKQDLVGGKRIVP